MTVRKWSGIKQVNSIHLFTGYEDNSKCIVPRDKGDNKLAIVRIASKISVLLYQRQRQSRKSEKIWLLKTQIEVLNSNIKNINNKPSGKQIIISLGHVGPCTLKHERSEP